MRDFQNTAIVCDHLIKEFPFDQEIRLCRLVFGRKNTIRGYRALDNVSLRVPEGWFVGLLGLNGAGKSTLLRVLGGCYEPTSGHVSVNGQVAGLYELGIAGNEHLTGREFSERWLMIQGIPSVRRKALLLEVRDFSELKEYYDQPIRTYSAGMKVRLFFSVATAIPQRIFLIDEALTVGDEHFVNKCWRKMRHLVTEGGSGLFATHDWSAVLRLCRHAYVLDKGRIVDAGNPQAVVCRYLGLEKPKGNIASFQIQDHEYEAETGKDFCLEIPVHVRAQAEVFLAMTIETFHPGHGWQNMLHFEGVKVADNPGCYIAKIKIPSLPLAAGEYILNVFLSSAPRGGTAFDCRSWTFDNGLPLRVQGASRKSVAFLPMKELEHGV